MKNSNLSRVEKAELDLLLEEGLFILVNDLGLINRGFSALKNLAKEAGLEVSEDLENHFDLLDRLDAALYAVYTQLVEPQEDQNTGEGESDERDDPNEQAGGKTD